MCESGPSRLGSESFPTQPQWRRVTKAANETGAMENHHVSVCQRRSVAESCSAAEGGKQHRAHQNHHGPPQRQCTKPKSREHACSKWTRAAHIGKIGKKKRKKKDEERGEAEEEEVGFKAECHRPDLGKSWLFLAQWCVLLVSHPPRPRVLVVEGSARGVGRTKRRGSIMTWGKNEKTFGFELDSGGWRLKWFWNSTRLPFDIQREKGPKLEPFHRKPSERLIGLQDGCFTNKPSNGDDTKQKIKNKCLVALIQPLWVGTLAAS